jgi:hypothetical protein
MYELHVKGDNYIMNKTNFNKVLASFSFTIKSVKYLPHSLGIQA